MRYFIVFLLLWSAVSDFFSSKLPFLGFIDELIVSALLVQLIFQALLNTKNREKKTHFSISDILFTILILWSIGSFVINGSSLAQLLKFLFSICKGIIIFYWLKTFLKGQKIIDEILAIIKWLIFIQLPFFFVGLIIYHAGYIGDNAVGAIITGDTSAVGTYFWIGIIICIALYERCQNKNYLIYAFGLSLLLIVTSTKQLTILLPVVLLYLYRNKIKFSNFKQGFFIGVAAVVGVILYAAVEKSWMQNNYGVDTADTNILEYFDESEKLLGYYSLLFELPEEIKHPIIWGAGPGMYGSYVAMNARAPLSQKYIMYYYDLIPEGLGGTLAYRSSSVIGFWGDIGLIGLLIVFAIYVYQTFHCAKKLKASSQIILYTLVIATGFLLLMQSFILNIFEGNSFTLNLFWIVCGISAAEVCVIKKESELCE